MTTVLPPGVRTKFGRPSLYGAALAAGVAVLVSAPPARGASAAKGTLTGEVLGIASRPLPDVAIELYRRENTAGCNRAASSVATKCMVPINASILTGQNGGFSISVPPGKYTIYANVGGANVDPLLVRQVPTARAVGHLDYLNRWSGGGSASACLRPCGLVTIGTALGVLGTVWNVIAGRTTTAAPIALSQGGTLGGRLVRFQAGQPLPKTLIAVETAGSGYGQLSVAANGDIEQTVVLPPGQYRVQGTEKEAASPFQGFTAVAAGVYKRAADVLAEVRVAAGMTSTLTVTGAPPRIVSPAILGARTGNGVFSLRAHWNGTRIHTSCVWEYSASVSGASAPYGLAGVHGPCPTTRFHLAGDILGKAVAAVADEASAYAEHAGSSPEKASVSWESNDVVTTGAFPA